MPDSLKRPFYNRTSLLRDEQKRLAAELLLMGVGQQEVWETVGCTQNQLITWLSRLRLSCPGYPDSQLLMEYLSGKQTYQRPSLDFVSMLQVDIKTGAILLSRMKEVLGHEYGTGYPY